MKFVVPIILIVVSGFVFFGYADPTYKSTDSLRKKEKLFNEALSNSKELQGIRDELRDKYNGFSTSDLERLKKLLPNNVDNVRLVRDLNGIASNYGMTLRNVKIKQSKNSDSQDISKATQKVGSIPVTFSVTGTYGNFISFLSDIEKSLRLVDVVSVDFVSSEKNFYEYEVSVRTYWLK